MDVFAAAAAPTGPVCNTGPVSNVVIPVFNRPTATCVTIEALNHTTRDVPFCITVVDNGSEPDLVRSLQHWREEGRIDHLFLLPRNMGVACAANVGWELVDAPLYMKRDNATAMVRRHWLRDLLALWRHGRQPSTWAGPLTAKCCADTPAAWLRREANWAAAQTTCRARPCLSPVQWRIRWASGMKNTAYMAARMATTACACAARGCRRCQRPLSGAPSAF